jgi:aspartate kinase
VGFLFLVVSLVEEPVIVMKFGGTSVEDAVAIKRTAAIVAARSGHKPVVVVSALAKVTDGLLGIATAASSGALAHALKTLRHLKQRHLLVLGGLAKGKVEAEAKADIQAHFETMQQVLKGVAALGELSPRTLDNVVSLGELLSSRMVTAAFQSHGLDAVLVDSRQCIVTDDNFTRALPLFEQTNERLRETVKPLLTQRKVPVMAGFLAATQEGIPTTLGRGGSDFSAAIVGAALGASRIEIWTDVEGMMTTDPRICPEAHRIEAIGFDEASELAYFGAKVLHPATLIPAVEKNIPVFVLNSRNPESKGTCIRARAPKSRTPFRAIAAKKGVKVINVRSPRMLMAHGFLRGLFEIFDRHAISADLVSTSEVSVSIAFDGSRDVSAAVEELKRLGKVEVEKDKAIICLVGENVRGKVGMAASVFAAAARANINLHMISQGASEINISFVVEEQDVVEAVRQLHKQFFESRDVVAELVPVTKENADAVEVA